MKSIACVCLMSMLSLSAICQTDFREGYIVQNNGDTVSGFVSLPGLKVSPELIRFKAAQNESFQQFGIADLKGFGFDGLVFESASVSINKLFDKNSKFEKVPTIEYEEKKVFLENLVNGSKKLYLYRDSKKVNHFYIEDSGQFTLLLYQEFVLQTPENGDQRKAIKKYLGQLYSYLSDCESIRENLKKVKYQEKSLISLFKKYNTCKGGKESITWIKKLKRIKPKLSVLVGLVNTEIDFTSATFEQLGNANFTTSSNIAFGISAELYFSGESKITINPSLLYTSFESSASSREIVGVRPGVQSVIDREWIVGFSYLKMQMLAKYNLVINRMRFFIGAGINIGKASADKNESISVRTLGPTDLVTRRVLIDPIEKIDFGQVISLGMGYKRYSVETRYEFGGSLSRAGGFNSTINSLYFLLGFRL